MATRNNICIMVDSGSDMLPHEAKRFGITLLPLTVRFGEEEFFDGVTISRDTFYNRLVESDEIPKTSQISPQRYEDAFREAIERGQEVVCLTLSSKISGSYQSAMIAAGEFGDRVHVVDTLQFCGPEFLLAQRAAELRDLGMSANELVKVLEHEKTEVKVVALFDTLEYLKLGGRLSSTAAAIGTILSIKPVLTITDGAVDIIGKARGSKNGNNYLMNYVNQNGGIDWDKPILLSWSGVSDVLLKKYIADSAVLYAGRNAEDLPLSRVGATIGTYTGPGAIAFSFFPKKA